MEIPRHVAIVPDGNRRWAKKHGLPTFEGHRLGFERAVEIGKRARELGIPIITFWGFSTENWKRDAKEIDKLMFFFQEMTKRFLKDALSEKIRIIHIGRKDRIPEKLLKEITNAEEKTKQFSKYFLVLALDYGGRDEIIRSIQKIIKKKLRLNNLTEKEIDKYLDTKDLPYPSPDLVIRTGGEERLSGYLIWQVAYSELMFVKPYFPDFTPSLFEKCIRDFSRRKRNFGA